LYSMLITASGLGLGSTANWAKVFEMVMKNRKANKRYLGINMG
jgi:hypothetical protein